MTMEIAASAMQLLLVASDPSPITYVLLLGGGMDQHGLERFTLICSQINPARAREGKDRSSHHAFLHLED
jgi:hypothetical protein